MASSPNLSTIQEQLRETVNIGITVDQIKQILDKNLFLVVLSPDPLENLFAGQPNEFKVVPTLEQARELTKGRNWNNANVLSAEKIRGTTIVM